MRYVHVIHPVALLDIGLGIFSLTVLLTSDIEAIRSSLHGSLGRCPRINVGHGYLLLYGTERIFLRPLLCIKRFARSTFISLILALCRDITLIPRILYYGRYEKFIFQPVVISFPLSGIGLPYRQLSFAFNFLSWSYFLYAEIVVFLIRSFALFFFRIVAFGVSQILV